MSACKYGMDELMVLHGVTFLDHDLPPGAWLITLGLDDGLYMSDGEHNVKAASA